MSDAVLVALITGAISLIGALINAKATKDSLSHQMETQQAIMETKLEELTREVRQHNDFAHRIPVLEARLDLLEKKAN